MSSSNRPLVQYDYMDLASVQALTGPKRGINVLAVVKFFREGCKTRGTSYSMTVVLTDPSLNGGKFICTVFNDDLTKLPQISANGDVVIFHRLLVERFGDRGEMRGCGYPGNGFASAVVPGGVDAPLELRSGWERMNVTEADLERAGELRRWYDASDCPVEKETAPVQVSLLGGERALTSGLRHLADVGQPNTFFDALVHVLAVVSLPNEPDCVALRVWDGSELGVNLLRVAPDEEAVTLNALERPRVRWLARHRAVDVFVFDEHATAAARIEAGSLLLLSNLHCVLARVRPPARPAFQLRLHGGGERFRRGMWRVDDAARDPRVDALHRRLIGLHERTAVSAVAARFQRAAACSLDALLGAPAVTWKHKVAAVVRAVAPQRAVDCLRRVCEPCGRLSAAVDSHACPRCGGLARLEMGLQVLLEGERGWILAHVWQRHAVYMFGQYLQQPEDILSKEQTRQEVDDCLQQLPGNELVCILVSYLPDAAADEERQYQIQDTQLVR